MDSFLKGEEFVKLEEFTQIETLAAGRLLENAELQK